LIGHRFDVFGWLKSEGRVAHRHCLERCDSLVLAGGLGTRIRPVLGDVPKLLAPIGERTYLDFLLQWLARFGARRVVFALGHGAKPILDHLGQWTQGALAIDTVVEPSPLGTAGAVRFARGKLATDPVLVLNGDSFVDADLCAFHAAHCASGAPGTILCVEVANAGRYGRVLIDDQQRIGGFREKDASVLGHAFVSAGVYFLSAALLDQIAAGHASSIERDVFERLPAGSLAAFAGCFRFIDIGTPETLALAESVLGRDGFGDSISRGPQT
jgi:mannose-1-phosphate guanylyltransferase